MKQPGTQFRMYVYILLCSDNSYYTGSTDNIDARFIEHQTGKHPNSYTFSRRPVEMVYHVGFQSIIQAIEVENKVKKWSRKKKEALITGEFDLLIELSKKKFKKPQDG